MVSGAGSLFSIVGTLGFEALRVYKRTVAGHEPIPKWKREYYFGVCAVAVFAAACAWAAGVDEAMKALFVGFSIPANAKAILDGSVNLGSNAVDDIEPAH